MGRQIAWRSTLVIMAAASLMTGGRASATAVDQIDITENSSTILTVTFDGSAVTTTNTGTDTWTFLMPELGQPIPDGVGTTAAWIEPGSTTCNVLTFTPGDFYTVNIQSDTTCTTSASLKPVADGTALPLWGTSVPVVYFTFTDLGDSGSVPEPATLALLGFSLAGLAFARRRRPN